MPNYMKFLLLQPIESVSNNNDRSRLFYASRVYSYFSNMFYRFVRRNREHDENRRHVYTPNIALTARTPGV